MTGARFHASHRAQAATETDEARALKIEVQIRTLLAGMGYSATPDEMDTFVRSYGVQLEDPNEIPRVALALRRSISRHRPPQALRWSQSGIGHYSPDFTYGDPTDSAGGASRMPKQLTAPSGSHGTYPTSNAKEVAPGR